MTAYRAPGRTPLCCSCGGASLTPPTWFGTTEGKPSVFFREAEAKPTLLGGHRTQAFSVSRAQVCLDCGHVMLGLNNESLEKLRRRLTSLEPFAD
jgi:hypothetical protein